MPGSVARVDLIDRYAVDPDRVVAIRNGVVALAARPRRASDTRATGSNGLERAVRLTWQAVRMHLQGWRAFCGCIPRRLPGARSDLLIAIMRPSSELQSRLRPRAVLPSFGVSESRSLLAAARAPKPESPVA
jgi:hypothetical protein